MPWKLLKRAVEVVQTCSAIDVVFVAHDRDLSRNAFNGTIPVDLTGIDTLRNM